MFPAGELMKAALSKPFVQALACASLALAVGCVPEADDLLVSEDEKTLETPDVFLDQGWSDETRDAFYSTTQGSRMIPYAWFLALERADSRQAFKAASNMRRMGYIVDEHSPLNPDRLPVGFAKDVHPVRGASLGLTCAGCHTGQIEFEGQRIRIDGGQSMGDLEQFQNGLLASLQATYADAGKFSRFADQVVGNNASTAQRDALRAELLQYRDWWAARIARSAGQSAHGPSRTDAFTIIANEVVCQMIGVPANCTPGSANGPTQYPFLWDTPDFEWVQYNSSVHSPLGRNVGEVTGVFAEMSLRPNLSVESTANPTNLHLLEEMLKSLRAPAWPADILGEIDQDLAAEGEAIFAERCISCHTEDPQPRSAPNAFGVTFAQTNFSTPLSVLGTDPVAAVTFATRRANPGALAPVMSALGVLGPDGKAPVAAILSYNGSSIIQQFLATLPDNLTRLTYLGFRQSRSPTTAQLLTYKARPLDGVAFTAPFLHNGSVASMYELLLPASQRLDEFHVGNLEYDPVHLGYSTERTSKTVLLDTALLGNSNAGHEFGTDLSDDQRYALIEYIKTL